MTNLYAQQRLSLPDVDAIGYGADGSWIDLYKKVGTDRYAQRRLQIDRKKIRISKSFCSLSDGLGFIFLQRYTK